MARFESCPTLVAMPRVISLESVHPACIPTRKLVAMPHPSSTLWLAAALLVVSQVALAQDQPAAETKPAENKAAEAKPAESAKPADPAKPAEGVTQAGPLPGQSHHGEVFNEGPRQRAYLMAGMPTINFPATSKVPEVQAFINQGVGQIHGFWSYEAGRSFRHAAMLDKECGIAYWGMAMANIDNPDRAKK